MKSMSREKIWVAAIILIVICATGVYYLTLPKKSDDDEPIDDETIELKPIKYGFVAALTGTAARASLDLLLGVKVAQDYVNDEMGGVLGRPILLVPYDSAYSSEKGIAAAERLVNVEGVKVFTGFYGTNVVLSVIPKAIDTYRIPTIVMGAWHDDVTGMHNKYVFRICNAVSYMIYGWVDFLEHATEDIVETRIPRIALLSSSQEYDIQKQQKIITEIERRGTLEVVYADLYPVGMTDYTAILANIKAANPDVLYGAGGMACIKQWYEMGMQENMMLAVDGTPEYFTDEWWEFLGDAGDYVCSITSMPEEAVFSPLTTWLRSEFISRYGITPSFRAYQAFDAVVAMSMAIENAGTVDDPDKIVEELEKIDEELSCGTVKFYMSDDPTIPWLWHQNKPPLFWAQYQGREYNIVYPTDVATTELVLHP